MARSSSLAIGLVLTAFLAASFAQPASACMCELIEPDTAYQQAILVFTGTVQKVTRLTHDAVLNRQPVLAFEGTVTHFTIDEYFKGTGGSEIDLRGGNTTCDFNFQEGKRYLVYASRNANTGAPTATACSRTQEWDNYTKSDISYLRRVVRGERPTMLYGFVLRTAWNYPRRPDQADEPVGDLTVTVQGEGKRLDLKTDASGYFETFDLPPGTYRVRTEVTGKLRGAEEKTLELKSDSVSSLTFRTTSMGSLRGRLVDGQGNPVSGLIVELRPPGPTLQEERPKDYTTIEEDGKFVFAEVPSGRYILAVNSAGRPSLSAAPFLPSYFPNAARAPDARSITITEGVTVELDDFILQERYPTVAVSGTVITPDGAPVPGAYVFLEKSSRPSDAAREGVKTDAAGRFVHQAFENVTYTLRAIADSPGGSVESDRIEITPQKNGAPVFLVVKIPR